MLAGAFRLLEGRPYGWSQLALGVIFAGMALALEDR